MERNDRLQMEKKIILIVRRILMVLLAVWMIVVFLLSNQNGEESSGLSHKVSLMITFGNEERAANIEPTIRKVAHMTEYAVGAMIFYGILITYQKFSVPAKIGMTFAFIVVCAGLDELHQSYIDARNGSYIDVGIDSFGGLLGIGASYLMEGMIRVMDNEIQEQVENTRFTK